MKHFVQSGIKMLFRFFNQSYFGLTQSNFISPVVFQFSHQTEKSVIHGPPQ